MDANPAPAQPTQPLAEVVKAREGAEPQQKKNSLNGLMKKFPKNGKKQTFFLILASILVVAAGVASGWLLSGGSFAKTNSPNTSKQREAQIVESDKEAGLADESQFSDNVEGKLVEGGIKGEGTHHLERDGGPSQNVYLTSTVIDLDAFKDKNVKVWGDTLSGQTAGWLMDVGKIKVVE